MSFGVLTRWQADPEVELEGPYGLQVFGLQKPTSQSFAGTAAEGAKHTTMQKL